MTNTAKEIGKTWVDLQRDRRAIRPRVRRGSRSTGLAIEGDGGHHPKPSLTRVAADSVSDFVSFGRLLRRFPGLPLPRLVDWLGLDRHRLGLVKLLAWLLRSGDSEDERQSTGEFERGDVPHVDLLDVDV